jgi:hypothetical protein
MSMLPTTSSLAAAPTWDGDRRVSGGALAGDPPALEGEDALTFADFLSVLNPLQHIPVVSTLYRWVTGDTIKPAARVVGGALYGGPIGMVSAALNAVIEQVKGADIGAQVLAMVAPDRKSDDAAPALVAAATPEELAPPVSQEERNAAALQQLARDLHAATASSEEAKPAAPPPAAPLHPGQGRTLAFYQANAGHRIPTLDSGRASTSKYALPVQTALAAKPLPIPAAEEKPAAESSVAPDGAPDAWFGAAMMRGLDRYRAASQQLDKAPPHVDLSQ